jgi:ADP-heptose:LPS heptosyltransferase
VFAQNKRGHEARGGLLIIHPGALGDVVAMFALFEALKKRYRRLTLVGRSPVGYLASTFHLVHQWISHEIGYWASLYTDRPQDRALQVLNGHRQILLFSLRREMEKTIQACTSVPCLRIRPRPPADMDAHVTDFAAKKLLAGGLIDRCPRLTRAVCRRSDTGAQPPAARPDAPTLLHPGAGSPRKRWPAEYFLEVAAGIKAAGGVPEILIGPAERDLLTDSSIHAWTVHVPDDIENLLLLLQSSAGFIGNDSGVAHLAACLGLPTTVIYTASDAGRWRPNGPAVETLSPDLTCQPCFETREENCPAPECLTAVPPDLVLQAYYRQIEKGRTDESAET